MKITTVQDSIKNFYDPYSQSINLHLEGNEAESLFVVSDQGEKFEALNNIIIFSRLDKLGSEQVREMLAYDQFVQREDIEIWINKHIGSEYYNHICQAKIKPLVRHLLKNNCEEECVFLGAGPGYEIKLILERDTGNTIKKVFASDISLNSVKIIPHQLSQYDIDLTLFTCDIDYCPIKKKDINLIIADALHHTPDMHVSIEKLLAYGYKNIYFIEPCGNILIKLFEKFGLARRVEESGLKPGRLDISKVKELANKYQYTADFTTLWVFPEDYYRKIFGSNIYIQNKFLAGVDILSNLTNYVKLGNFAIVHLHYNS